MFYTSIYNAVCFSIYVDEYSNNFSNYMRKV